MNIDAVAGRFPEQHRRWTGMGIGVALLGYGAVTVQGLAAGTLPVDEPLGLAGLFLAFGLWLSGRASLASRVALLALATSCVVALTLDGDGDGWSATWTLLSVIVGTGLFVGRRETVAAVLLGVMAPLGVAWLHGVPEFGWDALIDFYANVFAVGLLVMGFFKTTSLLVGEARDTQTELGVVVDSVPDALVRLDGAGRLTRCNAAAARAFFADALPSLEHPLAFQALALVVEDVSALLDAARRDPLRVLDRSGRLWEVRAVAVAAGGDLLMLRDVTQIHASETRQQALQEQVLHLQKLEAVGRLAGGVAHDFNNLLTAVGGLGDLLAESDEDEVHGIGEELVQLRTRGTALTRQMLALARQEPFDPRAVDLVRVLGRLQVLIERLVTEQVTLEFELPAPGRALILADLGQLEQVLLNLAANARDAMPDGGTLTYRVTCDEAQVQLEVADTGTGMDAHTMGHAFDAFFTTKPRGRGTGLGLAGVKSSVERQSGTVAVESTPGVGTRFWLRWPRTEVQEGLLTPLLESPSPLGAARRVLVVEDEPAVLRQVKRMLERAGYVVDTAMTVEQALAHESKPDLLLSDMLLPGGTGVDVAQDWRGRHPELPVVFMSGYLGSELRRDDLGGVRLLSKPFSRAELLDAVSHGLDPR